MKSPYILSISDPRASIATVGGKGASLAHMARAGLAISGGFYVGTEAYREFVAANGLQPRILAALEQVDAAEPDTLEEASQAIRQLFARGQIPPDIADAIVQAYATLPGEDPAVAVRSSATAEDLPGASFAGQQETYLNIVGPDAVLEATKKCWASLWTARAIGYRMRQGILAEGVALAVIVQLLVPADAAGILFTANPITGQRDQAVISAGWGLGEAVVGGLVTPDSLTVDKATGRVLERQIADKQVMTVRTDGGTEERSVPESLRRAPVLSDEVAGELTRLAVEIENLYGMPMDIEWALAEGRVSIVQARPITALPEPEPPAPTEWKLPKGMYAAARVNIIELMFDPLTPLFATLGIRAANESYSGLWQKYFSGLQIMPQTILFTLNHYAYYNGSISPLNMIKMFIASPRLFKTMFKGGVERWFEYRQEYLKLVGTIQSKKVSQLSNKEILEDVYTLAKAAIDAYGILATAIIPGGWITEGALTLYYNLLVKRKTDPPASAFLLGFDSTPIRAEKSLYDLAEWVRTRAGLATYLKNTPVPQLVAQLEDNQAPPGVSEEDWRKWQNRFKAYLQRYGHAIYNLDFAYPVPADDPAPLLETCKLFISSQGVNPHARQQAASERREQATQAMLKRIKGLRLKLFSKLIASAQRYAPLREEGLADIGLGYPLLRQMLRELGHRFAEGGMIEKPDDIFWLEHDEVEQAADRLDRGEALGRLTAAIPRRKAAWRAAKRVTPPIMLPQLKFLGIDLSGIGRGRKKGLTGDTLEGVAVSPGRVEATARVLHGPEDFSQMKPGDVLVAAITTPAWTPLFAMASAIVTDVGGALSHGSIVAREYGIPAVLGTGVATKRIQDGQTITVDGNRGLVFLNGKGE